MNIPIQVIVSQMDKEITKIKKEISINKKKERIAAIRALCDVILEEESIEKSTVADEAMLKMMVGDNKKDIKSNLPKSEGNGDSIFDF
ncbi:hypothetical protein CIB95_10885 [Lottiidibacillus patelloidae]|uniref:YwdI family protein n=1 Tax=Lottiidibacillus patelloidae TaxID=2670334 RepID=A0A263BT24_9BACI|nr:YwdI family protein [Lottiidibacillus patelloidae]OZM56718.1 hypothetical protein CIB95_10885 [Lottiidibacillus patelloidae]